MLSHTRRRKKPQRARRSTVSTLTHFEKVLSKVKRNLNLYFKGYFKGLDFSSKSSVSSDKVESDADDSLKYVPGKARTQHLQMMMSTDELEEERRSVKTTNMGATF